MKKQLLSIAVIFSSVLGLKAQAPDMGLETWVNVPLSLTIQDPTGWASFNALSAAGMPQSVFKSTTAPYAGTASAKIVTEVIPTSVAIPNPFVKGQNLDTAGILGIGKTQLTAPYVTYGYTYANRPATLSFACKYNPNPNNIPGVADTAYVYAMLTKWNGTKRDTVGSGSFKTWLASANYAVQTINMTYTSGNVMPDTQLIFVSSSIVATSGAKKGSEFYVDDFKWAGYVSTNDIAGEQVQVSIYPNPASAFVNFNSNVAAKSINIIDITGRTVATYPLVDNKVKFSTESYASGIYFYNLINNNNEIISRDKFEVVK